jgi:hypothetical protein
MQLNALDAVLSILILGVLTVLSTSPADPEEDVETTTSGADEAARIRADFRAVEGWDCSQPKNMQTVQTRSALRNCVGQTKATDQRNATFLLLQKADYMRVRGQRCVMTRTMIPLFCGTYDHQTLLGPLLEIANPVALAADECKEMYKTKKWTDPKGREHPLHRNRLSQLYYEEAGESLIGTPHSGCQGGRFYSKSYKKWFDSIVAPTIVKIHLEDVDLTIDADGTVVTDRTQVRLPCKDEDEECVTDTGTYVWDLPRQKDQCQLFKTREVRGIVVKNDEGVETFISQDGAMVRLILKRPMSLCGQLVYYTNYKKLMLSDALHEPLFQRKLDLAEMSTITYANQQDGFLYGTLTEYIQKELKSVLQNECRRDERRRGTAYAAIAAEQKAAVDGETSALGNSWFTTASGEAWYRYKCKQVVALAREKEFCYSSIPVELSKADFDQYLRWRGLDPKVVTPDKINFFIEPHTH